MSDPAPEQRPLPDWLRWWRPPSPSTDRRAAREVAMLFAIGRPFFVVVVLSGLAYLIPGVVPLGGLGAALPVFALAVVLAACLELAHRGRHRLGAATMVTMFLLMMSASTLQWGGVEGPLTLGFLQVLILAAGLGGSRSVVRFTVASIVMVGALHAIERSGALPAGWPFAIAPAGAAVTLVSSIVLGAFFLGTTTRALDQAIVTAEQSLARAEHSESELARRIREAPDGYLELGADGTVLAANPAIERMAGYPVEELLGKRIDEHPAWPTQALREDIAARVRAPDKADEGLTASTLRHRDGRLIEVETRARRVVEAGVARTQVVVRDVTERNEKEREKLRLEAQLLDARRLEALGRLAGGVAHDFRNLLTVVLGNAELLKRDLTRPDDREAAAEIQDAAERASRLTAQLLSFARKQVLATRPIDLDALLDDTWTLLTRAARPDIALERARSTEPPVVVADATHLEQVLVNLVVNARDAIVGPGRIQLETAVERVDQPRQGLPAGAWVRLTVRDTGQGMSEEVRSRVFEPFFTTKGVGEGTGLGLATVHGIVTQCGGRVDVESELGRGTAFHVYLPRSSAAPTTSAPAPAPVTRAGSVRVLVVDDEAMVRRVVVRALEGAGHAVTEADSAEAALALLEDGRTFDVFVSDVVMPGIGGLEFGRRVRATRPGARFLFVSGYSDTPGVEQVPGETAFLAKPFTPAKVNEVVSELLGSERLSGSLRVARS